MNAVQCTRLCNRKQYLFPNFIGLYQFYFINTFWHSYDKLSRFFFLWDLYLKWLKLKIRRTRSRQHFAKQNPTDNNYVILNVFKYDPCL